ncbi:hypothetical protein V8C34DRAFT_283347 [Trichoderma compactum]
MILSTIWRTTFPLSAVRSEFNDYKRMKNTSSIASHLPTSRLLQKRGEKANCHLADAMHSHRLDRPIFLVSPTHAGPIKALRSSPFVVPYSDHTKRRFSKTTRIKKKKAPRQLSLLVTVPLLSIQSSLVITLHIKGSN